MPTDIVLALAHRAEVEKQVYVDLRIVCLWGTLALVLSALIFNLGFDPSLAEGFVAAG